MTDAEVRALREAIHRIPKPEPSHPAVTIREASALGWLGMELASRVGEGNVPDWFPGPAEWLALWESALAATAQDVAQIEEMRARHARTEGPQR